MSVNIFSTVITKGVHKVNVLLPKVDLNISVFRCFLFCVVIIFAFRGQNFRRGDWVSTNSTSRNVT